MSDPFNGTANQENKPLSPSNLQDRKNEFLLFLLFFSQVSSSQM